MDTNSLLHDIYSIEKINDLRSPDGRHFSALPQNRTFVNGQHCPLTK